MPVHGGDFGGRVARQAARGPEGNQQQAKNAADDVKTMRGGKDIKETAARIGGEEHAGSGKLAPGDDLPSEKKDAEDGRDAPPVAKRSVVLGKEALAGVREREAAGD